jgi:1,4-dihydroxy-2-naphthoate polyprenyltransferase
MKRAVVLTALLSLLSGLSLLILVFGGKGADFWVLLAAGIMAIGAAITYTIGKRPYGYAGLGDIAVFLFFGVMAVSGTAFLHGQIFEKEVLLPAAGIGLLSAGVLNLNNLRDIENDRESGKMTLAVKLGYEKGKFYHIALIDLAFVCFALYVWYIGGGRHWWSLLAFFPVYLNTIKVFRTPGEEVVVFNLFLKQLALSTFLFTVFFVVYNSLVR